MRREFLATLHCPYSGLPLSLSLDLDEGGEEVNYGIASTEATDFPIVEGILRLHVDEYREFIVQHLRESRRAEAFTTAVDRGPFGGRTSAAVNFASSLAFRTGFRGAGNGLSRLKRHFVRVLRDGDVTFAETAKKLSADSNYNHQMCRFTMPGFLSTFALTHLVRPEGWVLSFACGTGHEPFLISRLWPDTQIVCADYSFCALYMAKKYFAPQAIYVCLDGDYLLPFESGQFSTIFSSDTLPILDSKLSLLQEFRRISDERAVTLLPHMHNRLVWPFAQSLTPGGYRQLFRDLETQIVPDANVVRDYFFNDLLDLTRIWSDEELAASGQHLSIIASRDASLVIKNDRLWEQRLRTMRHPCINPAYRISGQSGNWQLKRHADDYYTSALFQEDRACLPESDTTTARSVDTPGLIELQRADPIEFSRLARSLIILDLPERFMKQNHGLLYCSHLITARQRPAV